MTARGSRAGSRLLGFSQELFDDSPGPPPDADALPPEEAVARYPHIAALARAVAHDEGRSSARAVTTSSSSSSRWT